MKAHFRTMIISVILVVLNSTAVIAQNPIWTIPNKYIDWGVGPEPEPLPIPFDATIGDDYTGQPSAFVHNAIFSPSESLAEDSEDQLFSLI